MTEGDREAARYYHKHYLDGTTPKDKSELRKLALLIILVYQSTGGIGVQLTAEKSRAPVYSYVYAHQVCTGIYIILICSRSIC